MLAVMGVLAAGCATQAVDPVALAPAPAIDPELGVAPSPVVATTQTTQIDKPLPKGGGRYHVGKPYQIAGNWYYPKVEPDYQKVGTASWYGPGFHGRLTANGEIYDMNALTAAHPTMPLPSYARVTNLDNDRSVIVRVNDRGPFAHNRVIDLSKRTARLLGFIHSGTARVNVEYLDTAPLNGQDSAYLLASYIGPKLPGLPGVGDGTVVTAFVHTPRQKGERISSNVLASGAPFDPYLALTGNQGARLASRRFGRLPARQAGFDIAAPLSGGQFVRRSYASERRSAAVFAAIEGLSD